MSEHTLETCDELLVGADIVCGRPEGHRGEHRYEGEDAAWSWRPKRETEAIHDERQRVLAEGAHHSGIDIDALPITFDEWSRLDSEEKGAVLEGYFAIVNTLWTGGPEVIHA